MGRKMFDAFVAELKASARLRMGLVLIVGVLWIYGLLLLRDDLSAAQTAYRVATVKLTRLQSANLEGDWEPRLDSAKILQTSAESRLWRGETLGLARAAFQDYLNNESRLAGVSRVSVTMGSAEEPGGTENSSVKVNDDLWRVKAKIVFDFNSASFTKLLTQFYSQPRGVVIESLRAMREPTPRVEAVVVAYFQKPQTPPETAKK
jgi:hypothetical protein